MFNLSNKNQHGVFNNYHRLMQRKLVKLITGKHRSAYFHNIYTNHAPLNGQQSC